MARAIIRMCFPHKTASMFAHRALQALGNANSARHFSVNNSPPDAERAASYVATSMDRFVLVGPARTYNISRSLSDALPENGEIFDICQVRDPLDIMVSQYFSHGWIHPDRKWNDRRKKIRNGIASGAISIREYCDMQIRDEADFGGEPITKRYYRLSATHKGCHRLKVYYEDFYNDYEGWVNRISEFLPSDLKVRKPLISIKPDYSNSVRLADTVFFSDTLEYVKKYDIRRGKHIRSAAPGDHKHFLTRDEIADLRSTLSSLCPVIGELY